MSNSILDYVEFDTSTLHGTLYIISNSIQVHYVEFDTSTCTLCRFRYKYIMSNSIQLHSVVCEICTVHGIRNIMFNSIQVQFVLRFYGPVNPLRSIYLTTRQA